LNVLASVLQTQISELGEFTDKKNRIGFTRAYDDVRSACNACHEESGQKFINIMAAPPVSNQQWDISS
jgi:hypothetical protein